MNTVEYYYVNPSTNERIFKVVRVETADSKTFYQSHLNGSVWINGRGFEEIAPYNYESWKDSKKPIYLVEGEKCAERLKKEGLCSSTTPGGANSWKKHFAKFFQNRTVYILPDNDTPGKKYADKIVNDLFSVAAVVKIVDLPNLKESEDICDFLKSNPLSELFLEVEKAQTVNVQNALIEKTEQIIFSKPMSEFEHKEIDWLWTNRIPFGCVTLLEGDGGIGKSYIAIKIAACLSKGESLPESESILHPCATLIYAAEDDPNSVIRPRIEANDANLDLVHFFDKSTLIDKSFFAQLELEILTNNIRLVVIDPIVAFLTGRVDMSSAGDVRGFMKPFGEIAEKYNCAILVIRHWNKSIGHSASHRGSGSVDFRNAARSVLQVIKKGDERYLCLDKSNYGASAATLRFKLTDKRIEWDGATSESADDLLAVMNSNEKSESEEAEEFLIRELAESKPSDDIFKMARSLGLSDSTIKRAKKKLKIKSDKIGKHWFYLKYESDATVQEDQGVQKSQALNYDTLETLDFVSIQNGCDDNDELVEMITI